MKDTEKYIHFIKSGTSIDNKESLGMVSECLKELAYLKFPILPSVIIEHNIKELLNYEKIFSHIFKYIDSFEHIVENIYGDANNPMLLEITLSPNITVTTYPKIRNLGLTKKTISSIQKTIGEKNTKDVLFNLLDSILFMYTKLLCYEKNKTDQEELEEKIKKIKSLESCIDHEYDLIYVL